MNGTFTNFLIWAVGGLLALVNVLMGLILKHHKEHDDERIKELREEYRRQSDANNEELERQRDNVATLFEGQTELKDFVHLEVKELGRQVTQVEKVAIKLEEQVGRFVSDIESEKRTRAEANRQINEKLDELMRGVERRMKPR